MLLVSCAVAVLSCLVLLLFDVVVAIFACVFQPLLPLYLHLLVDGPGPGLHSFDFFREQVMVLLDKESTPTEFYLVSFRALRKILDPEFRFLQNAIRAPTVSISEAAFEGKACSFFFFFHYFNYQTLWSFPLALTPSWKPCCSWITFVLPALSCVLVPWGSSRRDSWRSCEAMLKRPSKLECICAIFVWVFSVAPPSSLFL